MRELIALGQVYTGESSEKSIILGIPTNKSSMEVGAQTKVRIGMKQTTQDECPSIDESE